jgi:transposase
MSKLSIVDYFPFPRVKIVDQEVNHNAQMSTIRVDPDKRYTPRCHCCGEDGDSVHSWHSREVRDLNLASTSVWLDIRYRKVRCLKCIGTRAERFEFCDAGKRITHRLARYIFELCKILTVQDVSAHLGIDRKTIKEIDLAGLEGAHGRTDYSNLRLLASDESAVKKGHNYLTIVLDYESGRVVWVGEGRKKETLDEFFGGMTAEEKARIEAVAMDMWEPFINRVKAHCPQAKIVFDLFHLVKAFGEVIDTVRRSEYAVAEKSQKEVIKGSRYLLLKNDENLSKPQRSRLKKLLKMNTTLSTIYILKDQLKTIYGYKSKRAAKRALDLWCRMAGTIQHAAVKKYIGRLKFFEYGILNHCDYPIGTSKLEGVNNKIKVIKRKSYGFHDERYFALKIIQAFCKQLIWT